MVRQSSPPHGYNEQLRGDREQHGWKRGDPPRVWRRHSAGSAVKLSYTWIPMRRAERSLSGMDGMGMKPCKGQKQSDKLFMYSTSTDVLTIVTVLQSHVAWGHALPSLQACLIKSSPSLSPPT